MEKAERMAGFIATFRGKTLNEDEIHRIIYAQSKNPHAQITCYFPDPESEEGYKSSTRIPYRDRKHRVESGIIGLSRDIKNAEFFNIIDLRDR